MWRISTNTYNIKHTIACTSLQKHPMMKIKDAHVQRLRFCKSKNPINVYWNEIFELWARLKNF